MGSHRCDACYRKRRSDAVAACLQDDWRAGTEGGSHYPKDWTADDQRPAIVFFSGGAWRTGGTGQFQPQAEYFAKRGLVTARAEYRGRNNDHVNPDTCLKDALSAMRWVRKNAAKLGVDPNRIVASGGSAGGYLAAAVATIKDFHSDGDDLSVSPVPDALILFNPVLDFVTFDRAKDFNILGELAQRISPLQHITRELPPTLILIGTRDNFLEQNQKFVSEAQQLGVRIELDLAEGQPHSYFNRSPWLEKTVASADEFLMSLGFLAEEPRVELPSSPPEPEPARTGLNLRLRQREASGDTNGGYTIAERDARWNPRRTAIIICDMWDDHTCKSAAARVAEMAPAIERTVTAARQLGVFIIHAPSGRMSFYQWPFLPQQNLYFRPLLQGHGA